LYALWFKIKEHEVADPKMRNLEYALYAIFLVYLYKFFDVIFILLGASDYADFVIPETFMPLGILILTLHFLLLALTLLAFKYRKELVGSYNFDEINGQIDSWE
jgi:protein-S-isoprenylcysteine O-methyltransferase Ste14